MKPGYYQNLNMISTDKEDKKSDSFLNRYMYYLRVVNPLNSFYQNDTILQLQEREAYLTSRENFLIDEEIAELDQLRITLASCVNPNDK